MRKSDGFHGDTTSIFINWLQQCSHWPGFQRGEVKDMDKRWAICPFTFPLWFPEIFSTFVSTTFTCACFAETHSLWSKRCWWRASNQSSSSSLLSVLKVRFCDPSGEGLMIDSLLDLWPDDSFSITRIRVSCSTKKGWKQEPLQGNYNSVWNETSLTPQKNSSKIKRFILLFYSELNKHQMCPELIKNPINQTNIQQTLTIK